MGTVMPSLGLSKMKECQRFWSFPELVWKTGCLDAKSEMGYTAKQKAHSAHRSLLHSKCKEEYEP